MEVQIQRQKLIKPRNLTPNHLRELKLSCFDQIAPSAYGSFIFFFPSHKSHTTLLNDQTLKRLESSLSHVLTKFYPLAGRLNQDQNAIDCNDEGVEYLEARVHHAELNQFIIEELEAKLINHLVPYSNELVFTPTILAIQINKFDCGGLAIGVSFNHKFADGCTMFSFVNEWATCCRIGVDAVKCLRFDTESFLPARFTVTHKIPLPDYNSETSLITKRFIFTSSALSDLKAKVFADHKTSQVSRAQLLIALIWMSRICMAKTKHGSLRDSLQIFPYNFRGKTALPIPPNAAGNLFKNVIVGFKANNIDESLDLVKLVNLVGNEIRNAAESFAKAGNAEDLFSSATDSCRVIHEELIKGNTDICILTSVCKFPYYEADFGWGKPGWIASVHKNVEMVLLMDTRFDGGIEAWVTLEPDNMVQFEKDPHILAYTCKPAQYFNQFSSDSV